MTDRYQGQCFCYPTKNNCEHCNRARAWIDQDIYTLANELGEDLLKSAYETCDVDLDNDTMPTCPECNSPVEEHLDEDGNDCWKCESCNNVCFAGDEEREPQDIMQWFIVSSWLHGQLQSIGEPVAEWKGLYWWGRTCCGQGIELDGTLQRISKNL